MKKWEENRLCFVPNLYISIVSFPFCSNHVTIKRPCFRFFVSSLAYLMALILHNPHKPTVDEFIFGQIQFRMFEKFIQNERLWIAMNSTSEVLHDLYPPTDVEILATNDSMDWFRIATPASSNILHQQQIRNWMYAMFGRMLFAADSWEVQPFFWGSADWGKSNQSQLRLYEEQMDEKECG